MLETSFTKLVGCQVPIQQAGMSNLATVELAAAVSEAGGLGMLGTYGGIKLEQALDRLQAKTNKPFGVNFLIPDISPETQNRVGAAAKPGVGRELPSTLRYLGFCYTRPGRVDNTQPVQTSLPGTLAPLLPVYLACIIIVE